MAWVSSGNFGAYKHTAPNYGSPTDKSRLETTWVVQRYVPTDLRALKPVARYKPIIDHSKLPSIDKNWYNSRTELPESGEGLVESYENSRPSTRCQEWSVLRQMMPSRGSALRRSPPNWGTAFSQKPEFSINDTKDFPIINSPMTR